MINRFKMDYKELPEVGFVVFQDSYGAVTKATYGT